MNPKWMTRNATIKWMTAANQKPTEDGEKEVWWLSVGQAGVQVLTQSLFNLLPETGPRVCVGVLMGLGYAGDTSRVYPTLRKCVLCWQNAPGSVHPTKIIFFLSTTPPSDILWVAGSSLTSSRVCVCTCNLCSLLAQHLVTFHRSSYTAPSSTQCRHTYRWNSQKAYGSLFYIYTSLRGLFLLWAQRHFFYGKCNMHAT